MLINSAVFEVIMGSDVQERESYLNLVGGFYLLRCIVLVVTGFQTVVYLGTVHYFGWIQNSLQSLQFTSNLQYIGSGVAIEILNACVMYILFFKPNQVSLKDTLEGFFQNSQRVVMFVAMATLMFIYPYVLFTTDA